ncbi:MAG: DUF4105 domain-containing protein [Candidatus Limnocylindria bacterium]
MLRARFAVLVAIACLLPATARASVDASYLAELIERSRELRLADAPQWRRLLHYQERWFRPGSASGADTPSFFLAPSGRSDPQAELNATLAAFFRAAPEDASREPAQCAFIARRHWLDGQLGFDPARLPPQPCPRFRAWYAELDPRGVTFVFPEAFLNNPSSMFGHTLLRLDTAAGEGRHDLIAWAINFAGAAGTDGGPAYMLKGLFGFYPGYYSIGPYYEKVKEYGDWESRDIWEYRLDLRPAETRLMLMHLWELQGISFDYFYFDENCSWQLLGLLEVARPSLRMTDRFPLWVIPADSLRAAVEEAGLLGEAVYRPSSTTQLRDAVRQLSREERDLALRVSTGELEPGAGEIAALPTRRRAAVLTVAYDQLRRELLAGEVERAETAARSRAILIERSRVDVHGSALTPVAVPRVPPHEGHRSARVALGAGWEDHRAFIELRARPSLHDLLDPQGGYTRGAEVQFLETALRWYPQDDQLRLHELVALDLQSLTTWDRFFRPLSWRFDTGLRSRLIPLAGRSGLDPEGVFRTHAGAGIALALPRDATLYGFAEATLDAGPSLDHDVAFGPGAALGLLFGSEADRWRAHAFAQATRFALGDRTTWVRAGAEQRLTLGRNHALELETVYERDFGRSWARVGLSWNLYF